MPTPTPTAPHKICIRCGTDVSSAPRVRDQQGRYVCQPCYNTVARSQSAPPPRNGSPAVTARPVAPASEAEELLIIPTEPTTTRTNPCPHCNQPTPADAIVCFNCGYNKQSGQRQKTKVAKEKKATTTKQGPVAARGTDNRATLQEIAQRQRGVLVIVGLYFGLVAFNVTSRVTSPGGQNSTLALVLAIIAVCLVVSGIVAAILLAASLQKPAWKVVVYALLLLSPFSILINPLIALLVIFIPFLALLRLSGQATKRLKKAGYSVGFMGAQGI